MRAPSTLLLLLGMLTGSCATKLPREEVITALQELANGYKHKDSAAILGAYAREFSIQDPLARTHVETSQAAGIQVTRASGNVNHRGYQDLLARELEGFEQVESAKFVLDTISKSKDGYMVDAWFNLYSLRPGGMRQWRHDVRPWPRPRSVRRPVDRAILGGSARIRHSYWRERPYSMGGRDAPR